MKLEKLLFCGLFAWGNPFAVSAQQLGGADFQPVSNSAVRSSFVRSDVSTAPVTSAKSPKIKEDFDFEKCRKRASVVGEDEIAKCMSQETSRLDQLIDIVYDNILNDPEFSGWNNGGTKFRGKLDDLHNTWVTYREDYCSLYAYSLDGYLGSNLYNTERCRLDLSRKHYDYMNVLIQNKHSTPD